MSAFKIQQARWAKGSIQAIRRLFPSVLRAPFPLWKKWQAVLHITGYSVHVLMVLLLILMLPIALTGNRALQNLPMAWLGLGTLGAPLLFAVAEYSLYPRDEWWKRYLWLPMSMILGIGLAVSNMMAVITGWMNIPSPFIRTPKSGLANAIRDGKRIYREPVKIGFETLVEFALSLYIFLTIVIYVRQENWVCVSFLTMYCAGFAWVSLSTFWEAIAPWVMRLVEPHRVDIRVD
jgi:hypothetical protein